MKPKLPRKERKQRIRAENARRATEHSKPEPKPLTLDQMQGLYMMGRGILKLLGIEKKATESFLECKRRIEAEKTSKEEFPQEIEP